MTGILSTKRIVWSQLRCDVVKELWLMGVPTRRIVEEMKISRDAIIGKAHRMKLPPHPSLLAKSK